MAAMLNIVKKRFLLTCPVVDSRLMRFVRGCVGVQTVGGRWSAVTLNSAASNWVANNASLNQVRYNYFNALYLKINELENKWPNQILTSLVTYFVTKKRFYSMCVISKLLWLLEVQGTVGIDDVFTCGCMPSLRSLRCSLSVITISGPSDGNHLHLGIWNVTHDIWLIILFINRNIFSSV